MVDRILEDFKDHIYAELVAAHARLLVDLTKLHAKPFSLACEHEIRVRRARYVLETAELEANLISIQMQEATAKNLRPFIRIDTP